MLSGLSFFTFLLQFSEACGPTGLIGRWERFSPEVRGPVQGHSDLPLTPAPLAVFLPLRLPSAAFTGSWTGRQLLLGMRAPQKSSRALLVVLGCLWSCYIDAAMATSMLEGMTGLGLVF